MNYRQRMAIERADKERILKVCPGVPETSGIYILTREDDDLKYAYIGQAKHLLTRLAQHFQGYQHIDFSLRKRKLWSEDNPAGWKITWLICDENSLDGAEQNLIVKYANLGYQLFNKTSGGQGEGKRDISDMPTKGYQQGLHNGYKKAQKEIAHLFKLHLVCGTKKEPPTKRQEDAMQKFKDFIDV